MKPITVRELLDYLQRMIMEANITPDFEVAVWIKDHGGSNAVSLEDITYHDPTTDHTEGFIAFHLLPD